MNKCRYFLISTLILVLAGCAAKVTNYAAAEQEAVLGVALLKQGYSDKSKFWIQTALQQVPNDAVLWNAWAYWLEDAGLIVQANNAYQTALKKSNHLFESESNYAGFLCRQHTFKSAMTMFRLAVANSNSFNQSLVVQNEKRCFKLLYLAKAKK